MKRKTDHYYGASKNFKSRYNHCTLGGAKSDP